MNRERYEVVVIGGGHAGVEAAWAAANLLPGAGTVALVTMDPMKIGVMSCNPAIGGLAKGQLVREIDALGGVMGLATDATGIQFRMLNTSKGPAVHGPRAQCDKHAYARAVQRLVASRSEIRVIAGSVEDIVIERGRLQGVVVRDGGGQALMCESRAVVLTTGTFMRGLMHTGEAKSEGGRYGEGAAVGISSSLRSLGFELGRLKTGTPPRLKRSTIDWDSLTAQPGDAEPVAFSELSARGGSSESAPSIAKFPVLPQVECRETKTTAATHELIRANLHRAPMYSGQIESTGPRYCPSIEDKVVRFAERETHGVFLEPESLEDDWIYCNGISTSLPADVQDSIVRAMPGCEKAEILRYGYAVEYDMVRPHQILPTGMTRSVEGLFLAGQINGTSGYEEAGAQGLVAGVNAARYVAGSGEWVLGRDEAYIGVLMDDLVTKTPVEPYRMFTSRAEHRLLLRADNAPERLTGIADRMGLLSNHELGARRRARHAERTQAVQAISAFIKQHKIDGVTGERLLRAHDRDPDEIATRLRHDAEAPDAKDRGAWMTAVAEIRYEVYLDRQRAEVRRHAEIEHKRIPEEIDFNALPNLRNEARYALTKYRPRTFGQAGRLEGMTPADITLLSVLVHRHVRERARGGES
ncbi:MAG: tRNA uridine-5-carboxymethylaminomethyl(34) synthesis enzyme MnmG [Phycisphaerales bacterium]